MLSIFKGFLLKVFFSIYSMFYEHNYSSLILYIPSVSISDYELEISVTQLIIKLLYQSRIFGFHFEGICEVK